ncbi:ShlB/FhaC/HecB family hemolysin secretion/activation protein [Rhizorhabdus dicambivorans]|uniref:ShlB/FhaC/HecB family hemolysin secretion/activation protein n=1 Tax=Rhizorhabdus dicambivorans TaxID=1850238 RepID=A0A2A4G0N5_9SPHN|nr:ShlB/FhaC/HecB family hemolysin secretion/activation protein [Rhizorhabdus dicambivorans]ATE63085.1 ShlB/FhaC/HecB family hemolysin secretion/activation protein [Rhizorhabdus dicambivorans]PCE43262.1 ShlB/FhaC/HecB family hemolysin secretion/activation protein [Rhizorhabdus dicambivorans]
MRSSLYSVVVFTALLFTSASNPALAQLAPGAPAVQQQQLAPTREEIDRNRPQQTQRSARLTIDGDIERAPCALDNPAYADIKVSISEAQFNNLQGITAEELKASYVSLLGPDRPISTICTIRDAAATALRAKGYLAAIQVPVQRIENGVVRFEVLFAKIVAIRVRGNAGPAEGTLQAYMKHLTEEKVFNRYTAERYLLLSREMPGYEVRLALKPAGTAPGELIGEISVVRNPLDVNFAAQNFSSHSSGRWSGALSAAAYGLIGADRLTASVSSTADFKEQQLVQLGYDTRLGGEGLTLSGSFTYAWSEPTIAGATFNIKARTLFATGEVRYPWIRTQAFSMVGAVGMDFLNQSVAFDGGPGLVGTLTKDKLRVGFVRLDFDTADVSERRAPKWRGSGSLEFRQGLNILDASPPSIARPGNPFGPLTPARADGDRTSSLVRASASFEYNIAGGYWIAVMPRAQYAFTPLFSFEEYSAGNFSIGRGYDPGVIIGDSGIGSAFELRLPNVRPFQKVNLNILPFGFTDLAWTWDKGAGRLNPNFVASVGGGLRALLNNRFRIDGTIAFPLKAAGLQTHNHDPRFLVSVTSKLWPWENQ